jgi:hypothetical protein
MGVANQKQYYKQRCFPYLGHFDKSLDNRTPIQQLVA